MARQLLDMQTRLYEMTSVTSTDAARVTELINEAIVDFARDAAVAPVLATFNTVIGQKNYVLTSVLAAGVLRILPDDPDDVTTQRDFPLTVRGLTTLVLETAPTAVVAVNVWVVPRPVELSAPTDPFPFDREWYRTVLYRSAQLIAEWDRQEVADIQMFEAKYELDVQKAKRQKAHAAGATNQSLVPSAKLGTSTGPNSFPFRIA